MPPAVTSYQSQRDDTENIRLACEACKRRKTKCNRGIPICEACTKLGRECVYPSQAGKPGPKPGWRKRKTTPRPPSPLLDPVEWTEPFATSPTHSNRTHRNDGNNLPRWAWIFHPEHDTLLVENSSTSPEMNAASHEQILGLDSATIRHLIEVYLENMTAITLFHRPTFWTKLESIPQPKVRAALLAAMFSFSTFYTPAPEGFSGRIFHDMAYKIATDALEECYGDSAPCTHLSQSAVLISFFELADGVRGKAWRTLGQTLRCAIEMKLNAVDANTSWPPESVDEWIMQEERRRLFWSLWEFDVFAGTIRRAPSAIDWKTCRTMLPVSDANWFSGTPQNSCFLHTDPLRRLKDLKASGNEGGRAWFIVINSYMREAHLYTEQLYLPDPIPKPDFPPQLEILENAAACFKLSLPRNLECSESSLEFKPGSTDGRTLDALRYSIYAMQQLTQMMIHRHSCVGSTSRTDFEQMLRNPDDSTQDSRRYSWSRFKHAAENVVRLARFCPADHVQSVSPFLASTIWIAAAALLTCEIFALTPVEADASRSKVEVLRLLLDHYASFWKSTNSLVYRLVLVRKCLKRMTHGAESRHVTPPDTPDSDQDLLLEAMKNHCPPTVMDPAFDNPLSDWLLEPTFFDAGSFDAYGTFDLDQFIMSITSGGEPPST